MRKTYGIILRLISQICIIALVSSLWFAACTKPETEQSGDRAIPVTSISLNKTTHSMTEGDSFRLIATIYPEDATNQNISWSSDSPQVASVDDTGLVIARQPGTATISVITEDGNKTASCQFSIAAQVMPSVTIGASNISAVSAVLFGKANLGSSSTADLKMGIMYSKSSGVLPPTSTVVEATEIEAEYYYSVSIRGLDPQTTYYYRSFVYQGGINTYGDTKSFTTKDIPSLIATSPADVLGPTEASANAKLDLTDCMYSSLVYGFYYGNDAQHLDSFVSCEEIDKNHNYSRRFSGLTPVTTYYYQAAAILDGREFSGGIESYTTAKIEASVNTIPASNITEFKATLNGSFSTSNADTLRKSVWFLWSKTAKTIDELKANGTRTDCELNNDGSFSVQLDGLDYNAEYHYVAVANVLDEEFLGEPVTFSTSGINATVTTLPASEITEFRARLNGKLNITSTENLSKEVWFLWSKTAKTKDELVSSGERVNPSYINSDGTFSFKLMNLDYGTEFHYVSVLKVQDEVFYGEPITFSTQAINANVTTNAATEIGFSVATLNGSLSVNTTENLNKTVWFLWSKTANDIESLKTSGKKVACSINGDGSFIVNINSLASNTRYFFVACAQVYDSVFWGQIQTFTTGDLNEVVVLNTEVASNVTASTATMNGSLSVNSTEALRKTVWFRCSEKSSSLEELLSVGVSYSATLNEDGSFASILSSQYYSSLNSNETYYYVAVAKVYDKEFYGKVFSFTTKDFEATVTTSPATEISEIKATLNGALSLNTVEDLSKHVWFKYSPEVSSLDELLSSGATSSASIKADGTIVSHMSSLSSNTTYYYVAGAQVNNKRFYGNVSSFTTRSIDAMVTTIPATNVTEFKACINGSLSENCSDYLNKSVWFLWSKNASTLESLKASGTKEPATLQNDGSYAANLTALINGTTYYYVAVSKIHDKEFYGDVKSFTTVSLNDIVALTTNSALDVAFSSATLSGSLSVNSTESLGKSVWFLYDSNANTIETLKSSGTKVTCSLKSDGSFASTISALSDGTTYYYVAVAKVYDKEFYGNVLLFVSKSVPQGAVDLGLSVCWAVSNLGTNGLASNPQDCGTRYAWGETSPKSDYSWSTYKWGDSQTSITKYNNDDCKTELKDYNYQDDAARVNLGGNWRIPNQAEWKELRGDCSWQRIQDYNGSGISGYIITGKKKGYTDHSIFIPELSNPPYWTSNIEFVSMLGLSGYNYNRASTISIRSNVIDYNKPADRCNGCYVRPVTD